MKRNHCRICTLAFWLTCAAPLIAAPSFQGLGDFNGGQHWSSANAISADGSTVVGFGHTSAGRQAFRWTIAEGFVGLGAVPGFTGPSAANAVSADGSVIVGYSENIATFDSLAFRWTPDGGTISLGDLPGGDVFSVATGVSADGSTIVGTGDKGGFNANRGFQWTAPSGLEALPDIPGGDTHSVANAISADGRTITGYCEDNRACRWIDLGIPQYLPNLPDGTFPGYGMALNADGSVIIGKSFGPSGSQGFRWSQTDGMTLLGTLFTPGDLRFSFANGVSADGNHIVGHSTSDAGFAAYLWKPDTGVRSLQEILEGDFGLNLTGWQLTRANGISADGTTIVGEGINPGGATEAWIATIPEPTTMTLLLLCGPAVARRRPSTRPTPDNLMHR